MGARAQLFTGLPAPSGEIRRDARRDAAVGDQHRLLPDPDRRHAGCDHTGEFCRVCRTDARGLGAGRYCGAMTPSSDRGSRMIETRCVMVRLPSLGLPSCRRSAPRHASSQNRNHRSRTSRDS